MIWHYVLFRLCLRVEFGNLETVSPCRSAMASRLLLDCLRTSFYRVFLPASVYDPVNNAREAGEVFGGRGADYRKSPTQSLHRMGKIDWPKRNRALTFFVGTAEKSSPIDRALN
jgi:hypothetical protein